MKPSFGTVCAALLLVAARANPSDDGNTRHETKPEFLGNETAIFTTELDIVNIVAVNGLTFDNMEKCFTNSNEAVHYEPLVYFSLVGKSDEKTPKSYGEFVGLGPAKNKTFHKILENGLSVTVNESDNHIAYIGAEDGIYKYNVSDGTISKYGTIDDTVIQIHKVHGHDYMYILSAHDKRIYNITDNGKTKTVIDSIPCATNFVIDHQSNIYYHCDDYKVFVLPEAQNAPVSHEIMPKYGILVSAFGNLVTGPQYFKYDGTAYELHPDGSYGEDKSKDVINLTAYSEDVCFQQYLAYNGNLYEPDQVESFLYIEY